MTEEEKQERSDNATAQDIDAYLTAALENLMEVYSITTRWGNNPKGREDFPYIDSLRTQAKIDLIGQYVQSIESDMSRLSIRKIR